MSCMGSVTQELTLAAAPTAFSQNGALLHGPERSNRMLWNGLSQSIEHVSQ